MNEGSRGELLNAYALLELLDVLGEDGLRSYLVGFSEEANDATEDDE